MLVATCLTACEPPSAKPPLVSPEFSAVPESVWVEVRGPTLVAFYPLMSNAELEADPALAGALDDLAYHIGTAMDSLHAAGYGVEYCSGDTVWMRTGTVRSRFVRSPDSAAVGYVFTDTTGRRAVIYRVLTHLDLVEYAHEFKRAGAAAKAPTP